MPGGIRGSTGRRPPVFKSFMINALRSALFVCAAISAAQVAPAEAPETAEPLVGYGSSVLPTQAVIRPIVTTNELPQYALDPLAPVEEAEEELVEEEEVSLDPELSLAEKVAELRSSDPGDKQMECLAAGIYFESKGEPLAGQLAVGQVIANRASSGRFPSSYCAVLFQRKQFSFVRKGRYPSIPRSSKQWKTAVAVAKIVDSELHDSPVPNALFFHAKYVSPKWRLKRVGTVGNHIFYR